MKPRLLALLLSIILGVSAAHAQQNPLSDFFHGLGGIFKGTPETQPADQTTPRQSKDLTAESQRLLARLGFDPGSADGIDGPKTRRAIEAFQREQGLTADGQVSDELITRLRMAAAVTTPVAPQSPPPMILTIDGLAPGVYDPTGFVSQTPGRIDSYLMPRIKKSWGEFWNLEEWKNLHYVIWGGDATSTALAVESAKVDIQQLMHAKAPVQSLVIVTHSWGSVIAYRAIIDLYEQGILKPGDVDTFISTGSPLNAQGTVWRKLARGFFQWSGPAPVANAVREWRNYYIESADKKSGPIPGTYANLTNISLPYTGARGKSAHKAYHADPLLLRQIGRDLLNTLRKPEPLVPPTETVQQPTTPSTTTTYMTAEAGTGESWIGIRVTDPRCGPPEVTEVVPGSPVDKAGVRPGDVILEFIASQWPNNHGFFGSSLGCGLPGQEATRLFNAVQDTPAGQSATLTIRRDKKRLTLTLIVGTRPAMPTPGGSVPAQTEAIHPSQSSDVSSLASNQMGTIVL